MKSVLSILHKASFSLLLLTLSAQADESTKRGIGVWPFAGLSRGLENLGVRWMYNWDIDPGQRIPKGIEFVPMVWDGKEVNPRNLANVKRISTILLGFNEPNEKLQANMSVDRALDLWPQLEATGMRLGSPAPSNGAESKTSWFGQFMKGVQAKGYRIDFICLHRYSASFTNPAAATADLRTYLQSVHELYQKPIWLTEFALANWKKPATAQQQQAFMEVAVPMLESLPYVERYAWFALPPNDKGDAGALAQSNLCDEKGNLTSCGISYQNLSALPAPATQN